ncbi:MAG: hypothetical protein HOP13_19320 [Alphaproteobacteria bacterium]|jgi:hypothetical protein|nr:hypothetical protein [Alphaproteobacteria bacterium]
MIRSIAAVIAGLVFIFATHIGTDEVLHAWGVFPPEGQRMSDPWLNALALGYRSVFSVLGCALTAWLAPVRPMAHALVLGGIGTVLASLGAYVAIPLDLGPMWYPIALAASALPCAWAGGMLVRR